MSAGLRNKLAQAFGDLVIRAGTSPRGCASVCPEDLKEAKPKAGTAQGVRVKRRGTDRKLGGLFSEGQKPGSQRHFPVILPPLSHLVRINEAAASTRRKSIGPGENTQQACGPGRAEMRLHQLREQTCEGSPNPKSVARADSMRTSAASEAASA